VRSEDNQAKISGCVDSDWKVHAEKTGYAESLREGDKCKMENESLVCFMFTEVLSLSIGN